ncbi:MAG TPA: hypothetical protein PLX90_07790, partial [Anaerolineales bacterium]|nr:hypothetical protein [Anaerolineales bacterium]
ISSLILVSACCLFNLNLRRFLLGCYWQECAPQRNFHVRDWKIPVNFFPEEVKVTEMMIPSEGSGEIERGSQNAFWDNGNGASLYSIDRYATIKRASEKYENRLDDMVDDVTNKVWVTPSEITFSSLTADEAFIACGTWIKYGCGMLARYQEYVIFFNTIIDEEMTYSDFEKIAIYLDEQITSRLYP